ncbi:GNAT family N-acetyltransferase [Streptomyces sp. NPDC051018]|uniref:GNAT family N-acetyltransferase n=1 Tax=Streptomyces sp. NPDC051018 TaxID=3365639 RepID=UPI0037909CC7
MTAVAGHGLPAAVENGVYRWDHTSMRSDVTLRPLDDDLLHQVLDTAVSDADPLEVMPPVGGPGGWSDVRRAAFLRFHRSRALAPVPVESSYAIMSGPAAVGVARLFPLDGEGHTAEAGMWIGRSHRGRGIGRAVFALLLDAARDEGFDALVVYTSPENTAVQRILTERGITPAPQGDTLRAWVDLHNTE